MRYTICPLIQCHLKEEIIMPPKEPEQIKNENQNPQPIPNLRTDELGITYDKYMKLRFAYASAHIQELGKLPSNDEVRQEYDSMTDEELMTRYNHYLSECPKHWEGQARETMERWIQNTGNPTVISDYLNKPDIPLSYEQQYLLRNILKSSAKISEQQLIAKQRMAEGKAPLDSCDVSVEPNQAGVETIELKNVHQKAYQTSGSGCWSCFFQVLASAKGLDITQEDIRGYRPNLKRKQAEEVEEEAYIAHNKDGDNNAFEMGDTILSYMPNTMLSEVMISRYDETAAAEGISKEQYLQSAYDQIKKTVTHALKEEHSPVGVLISGHYTTIVGIEGDKVKFKNSVQKPGEPYNPDATHEKTLEELFGKVLSGEQPAVSAIQLTYAKDIKLSKDGKTVFGVPSDYVEMYPDGSLSKQPNEIREGAHLNGEADPPTNRHGFQVSRYGRVEDTRTEQEFRKKTYNNIIMTERVYLPKKLDTAYLKKQAEERTLEEENRLRQIDRDEFGMDRKPLKKSDIQQEKKAEQDLDNLPQNSSTQRKLREQFDQKLAQKREEAAQQRVLDAVEPTRMEGLKKGFADIRDGKHPELFDLQFMTNPNYKMENLQDADLQKCEDLIAPIFGEDIRHTDIIRMESVLSKFTYKKTPDSQPVNLADDVRSRLQAMPKYQKAGPSDETVFKYVKAELMHLMTVKDAALTYENGENSLRDIYNPVPVISPEEKIAAASQPVKDKDKRFVQKLQESNIPHADATNLYQTVVGLGNDELNNLVGLYKAIFTDTKKYYPSDMTFKVQPYQGADFLEDMQYAHLSYQQKPTTPPEAYNKEVWKKSETDNTMRTKMNNIAKLQMAATVIGAANNLGVKHNGKEIPSLENVVFGKEKQQKQITDKMRAADMPLTPVEGKQHYDLHFSVEMIQQNLEHMLAEVEGADYSKWTRSSKQFRTMKTKLKELNKLVNVTWAEKLQRGEPITFEMMDEFVQKSDVLQEKIVDYLEHKDRQIIKDPERRNRPSKQEYEQKRIGVSITMLDSLRKLSNEVSGAVLNTISADAKEFFSKELADEEFRRSDMDITKKQFTASARKSLELMNLLDKETYTRKIVDTKKETLSQARERIIGAVNAVYDEKHLETICKKDRSIETAREPLI